MKRTTALLTALSVLTALAVPMGVSAEDTQITPKGGTPVFDAAPNPGTADATVGLGIDPAYTVTIPAEFKLDTKGTDGKYSGSGTLTAESVFLNEGKVITVSLTSASEFRMQTAEAVTYKLPYTAAGQFGEVTDKKNGGNVAQFSTKTTVQNVTLSLKTDEVPAYAGKFTDPVVFHISVENAPAND